MFVTNVETLENVFKCKKAMAKYLMSNSINILSIKDGMYYFNSTSKVEKLINNAPVYLKLVERW